MQYWAAPRLEAACRIRFSLKKAARPAARVPSPPKTAPAGTSDLTQADPAWSVGMLKVHRYSSTVKPGELTGVRRR